MTNQSKVIPFIDVFAGPGGLGEGFQSLSNGRARFSSVLAIEKDPVACKTLRLRSFFHQFASTRVPDAYYKVLRGALPQSALESFPEWATAGALVWNAELGKISTSELHEKINERLEGRRNWVLLGGPPCQAYSLIGRSRMTGIGHRARVDETEGKDIQNVRRDKLQKFAADVRHELYREYLRIVAVHQPAVFVMENVKGILSSTISKSEISERVFSQIRNDLSEPWEAIRGDKTTSELAKFKTGRTFKYRLYSFVAETAGRGATDREFLVRCEQYGVPQARHRVVILGVREDLRGRPKILTNKRSVTVRDVLESLPALRSGVSKEVDDSKSWLNAIRSCFPKKNQIKIHERSVRKTILKFVDRSSTRLSRGSPYIKISVAKIRNSLALNSRIVDRRLQGVVQHETRTHMKSDLGRYLFASATAKHHRRSPRIPDWPEFLLPRHKNVDQYRAGQARSAHLFVDRFKVQIWDRPSSTVTSHISKDGHYFIHPDPVQCRSLTVREAARLQTFPDNYFFCGNRTQQYHQVGNAVPPFIAMQMASVICEFLLKAAGPTKLE
jgi:DNA (cytosine-5)-methyltransferase 1